MQTQLSDMDKVQLRAACKTAGIKNYGKMTVEVMRAALTALTTTLDTALPSSSEAQGEAVVSKDLTPQREVRNGVRKPVKGVCADVWMKCSELHDAGKLDAGTLLAWSDEKGLNRNNTRTELSAFRRFHEIARPTV